MTASPKKLWQWVLAYPAVPLALIPLLVASFPTVRDGIISFKNGVPFHLVGDSGDQERQWQINAECLRTTRPKVVKTKDGYLVLVTACDTGSVLVEFRSQIDPMAANFRWIPRPKVNVQVVTDNMVYAVNDGDGYYLAEETASYRSYFRYQTELIQNQWNSTEPQTLCQWMDPATQMIFRVLRVKRAEWRVPICYKQTINPRTNSIEESVEIECDACTAQFRQIEL